MTLRDLIKSEPANAARSNAEVLAWLNERVDLFVDVSWLDLSMWVAEQDLRTTIAARVNDANAAVASAAQHIVDCIVAGQPLAMGDARVRATIGKALPSGAARNALLELSTKQLPRWSVAGVKQGEVTLNHVAEARNA